MTHVAVSTTDEHQAHLKGRDYHFATCVKCREILGSAMRNHNDHAGHPDSSGKKVVWVTSEHTNSECVDAYRRYGQRMSES